MLRRSNLAHGRSGATRNNAPGSGDQREGAGCTKLLASGFLLSILAVLSFAMLALFLDVGVVLTGAHLILIVAISGAVLLFYTALCLGRALLLRWKSGANHKELEVRTEPSSEDSVS